MNVLYVNQDIGIDWCSHSGGAIHIQSVVRAMRRLGHSVEILARKRPEQPCPTDLDIPCYLQSQDVPWKRFDLVYERYSLWGDLSLSHLLPWYLEINAPLIEEQVRFRRAIDVERAAKIRDAVCHRVERILVVSTFLAEYVPLNAHQKIVVVPNGVDRQLFHPLPVPPRFAFGYVGSMRPWHDLDTPLQAFMRLADRFPAIDFHVIGSSPRETYYRESYQHPRVFFRGLVSPASIPALLEKITCGIAPFIEDTPVYFSPLKIREYLATHRTVITHPRFAEFPGVTEGVQGVDATCAAMEQQIHLDRKNLRFPEIPDWQTCINLS